MQEGRLTKKAELPATADYFGVGLPMSEVQANYAKWLGKFLMGTAATGAAVGGAKGLMDMIKYNAKPNPEPPAPMMINVPYKPKQQPKPIMKQAGLYDDAVATVGRFGSNVKDTLGNMFTSSTPQEEQPGFGRWFMGGGHGVKEYSDMPVAWPATILGGAGAAYLGKNLADKGMKYLKDRRVEQDVEDAREEYQQALLQQFKPLASSKVVPKKLNGPALQKAGSTLTPDTIKSLIKNAGCNDKDVKRVSDKLEQLSEKVAFGISDLFPSNWSADSNLGGATNKLTGLYAATAPVMFGTSALAMYNFANHNNPEAELAKKLKKQNLERWAKRPPDVFANLVPVDDNNRPVSEMDDEVATPKTHSPIGHKIAHVKETDEINQKAAAFVRDLLGA